MIISNIVQLHYLRLFHKTLTTDSQIINKPKTKPKNKTKQITKLRKGIVTDDHQHILPQLQNQTQNLRPIS